MGKLKMMSWVNNDKDNEQLFNITLTLIFISIHMNNTLIFAVTRLSYLGECLDQKIGIAGNKEL